MIVKRCQRVLLVVAGGLLLAIGVMVLRVGSRGVSQSSPARPLQATLMPSRLSELLSMAPEQIQRLDIAALNLLCAQDLPGSETLDLHKSLVTLDQWAATVKRETDRHHYKFRMSPGEYNNSEGYFRMLMLVTVLQQDLGVRYNADRVREIDFRRSQDLFIHGLLFMPAVCRRCRVDYRCG